VSETGPAAGVSGTDARTIGKDTSLSIVPYRLVAIILNLNSSPTTAAAGNVVHSKV
jgi:hypothetical protein